MHRELGINHRHFVRAHLGGAALMPIGDRCVANESVIDLPLGARDTLTANKRMEGVAAANLAAKPHTSPSRFQIPRIRQHIGVDDRHVARIGRLQAYPATTMRAGKSREHCPAMGRNAQLGRSLTRNRKLHLAEEQIRFGEVGTAFPVLRWPRCRCCAAEAARDIPTYSRPPVQAPSLALHTSSAVMATGSASTSRILLALSVSLPALAASTCSPAP